jgi:ubiquitin fusion degradation protein 1
MEVDYPMLFQMTNEAVGRGTHCGVLEFTAEEGRCYMPFWMMQNLCVEEGSLITVKNVSLSTATFVKFRAQSCDFLDISNPRAVLEYTLRKYTCLTTGDMICLPYNGQKFYLEVTDVQPAGKASIVECNVNIDFDEPVGYKEFEAAQNAKHEAISGGHVSGGTKEGGGSSGTEGPVRAVQRAKTVSAEEEAAAASVFAPFKGAAQRVDGKATGGKAGGDDAKVEKDARLAAAEARAAAGATAQPQPVVATERKSRIGDKFSKKASAVSAFGGAGKKLT